MSWCARLSGCATGSASDRILFGSDMAGIEVSLTLRQWVHQFRMLPEWAKQLGYRIPGTEIDLILGENTRRVYKIPSPPVPGRKSEP